MSPAPGKRQAVKYVVGILLLVLAALVGLTVPAVASEPATVSCDLEVLIDPGPPPVFVFVTVLTVEHEGQVVAQVVLDQPPSGPLSTCRFP